MTKLTFNPADHPDAFTFAGHTATGVPIYRPVDLDGCGGCENDECCGACVCCASPHSRPAAT